MTDSRELILIVDDEPRMTRFIRMNLEIEKFRVIEARDGLEALDKVRSDLPNLVILDVMMPELDGFETLKMIREVSNVPVIMVTVRADEEDKVRGLELGADDYVTKPFGSRELVSRVKAVLRRTQSPVGSTDAVLRIDERLSIDFNNREVIVEGNRIKLRPTEFRLLYHLVEDLSSSEDRERPLASTLHSHRAGRRISLRGLQTRREEGCPRPARALVSRQLGSHLVSQVLIRQDRVQVEDIASLPAWARREAACRTVTTVF